MDIETLKKAVKLKRDLDVFSKEYEYFEKALTGKTIYTNGLTETEWIPTSSDILENDWEIYEEE